MSTHAENETDNDAQFREYLKTAIVDAWFDTLQDMNRKEAVVFFADLIAPSLTDKTLDDLCSMANDAEIEFCSECGASLDDGEGWDGLCGTHADIAERKGRFT
jgi:hypothetical protein